ncbi:ribose-5-phosphate isomerase RpiA [uncultured Granulicatella sp.]|uniref:ribose-5-phosphate isomerase RpiA n=1 Tax=uncultured Granulicatella sp. TaxID=316089 RepID=UPI0028E52D46|nr:ribose-5-phosphate isomerase RpiA [uncultured Granulicatella sp.]
MRVNMKEMVGKQAATYIESGMTVGLGTGSTAYYFVEEIGRRVKEEGLDIIGVTTSKRTKEQAEKLGIPLKSVDEVDFIDVTVDGADEIAPDFSGIKGGGGALLFEKIVAEQSKRIIWIVDESKMVDYLGRFPLPVEVIPYGSEQLFQKFEAKGYRPKFRVLENGERYLTDSQNYIIDLDVFPIKDPVAFGAELKALTGVVEQGLFTNMTETVLIGTPDGVKVQTLG